MALNNPYNQYKENSVLTASPQELTLMLFNGAIKFINLGRISIEKNDIEGKNNALKRAQDIISELNMTLDMNYDISKSLRPLYLYINERLLEANLRKDTACLDEAQAMVTELRDTWKEAMKIAKTGK